MGFFVDIIDGEMSVIDSVIEKTLKGLDFKCRFSLFFVLNDRQSVLYRCFDSERGFVEEFSGIKLFVTEQFGKRLKEEDEFEMTLPFGTNYPFLYDGFGEGSSLFVKKIYSGSKYFGFVELAVDTPFVTKDTKALVGNLINNLIFYLCDAYDDVVKNMARKFFCLNALQMMKTIRPRTFYHSFRVADISVLIARKLGLDSKMVNSVYYASLIHDVGEVWIPNDILDKRGKLTDEEMELVKSHPMNLKAIFLHNPFVEDVVNIALYHHERVDGRGYYGKKSDEIPMLSKILAVAEFVDGLHTDRPDRPGLDKDSIVYFLKRSRDTMFDSGVVDIFLEVVDRVYGNDEVFVGVLSGKPAILLFYKKGSLNLIKGCVEYSTGKNLGISLNSPEGKGLSYGDRVGVQLPSMSKIIDINAEVMSSTEDMVNLSILGSEDVEDKSLEVNWEFGIIVIPLKTRGHYKGLKQQLVQMKTVVFGTKYMLAKASGSALSVGDTVLIKAKPLDEVISIPAVVSDVVDEGGTYTIRFEYFGLNEAEDAKIHRAVYSKQVSLASG